MRPLDLNETVGMLALQPNNMKKPFHDGGTWQMKWSEMKVRWNINMK